MGGYVVEQGDGKGSREQRGGGEFEGVLEPRVEEGPHALGRVLGRAGCAGVNVIGCGGPWQGGLPGSTKHRMVKPCSLGVHPRACGRSLNGTPTTELSVSNHEDRRVRPTSRTVYPHLGCPLTGLSLFPSGAFSR